MKCNREVNTKWFYLVTAMCWGLVAILKIGHGEEWTTIALYVVLAVVWGFLSYKTFKEEKNENGNC